MLPSLGKQLLQRSCWVVLCSLLLATGVVAAPREFVIGVEEQPYLPFYTVVDGQYQGYGRELLDAFAQARGYQFRYKPLPVKRLHKYLMAGKLDFKFPDNPMWRNESAAAPKVHYSAALTAYIDGVLVKPVWLGLGMEHIKVLGAPLGFSQVPYQPYIDSGQIKLVQIARVEALLKMAKVGRLDAIYMNPLVARQALRSAGLAEDLLVYDDTLPHVSSYFYLSSIEHPEVLAELDRFLLDEADLVLQLKSKYGITE